MQTLYLDITLQAGQVLELAGMPAELAIYPISGELEIDGSQLAPHSMALLDSGDSGNVPLLRACTEAHFVVIGGEALDGPRFISWNFVASSKERIAQAAEDWRAQRMGQVPGETEWIPLPAR